jgi:hypothetical protein
MQTLTLERIYELERVFDANDLLWIHAPKANLSPRDIKKLLLNMFGTVATRGEISTYVELQGYVEVLADSYEDIVLPKVMAQLVGITPDQLLEYASRRSKQRKDKLEASRSKQRKDKLQGLQRDGGDILDGE